MNVWNRNRSTEIIGAFLAVLLAVLSPWVSPHAAGKDRPNIIFIMADDLGYNDLGAYGQTVTLLIVTSDNGGLSPGETRVPASVHRTSDPWRGQKASHYEGGHRVPFLARWPGRIEPGSISDSVISLVDLTATAAALVGASLPAEAALDSFDMLPALQGKDSIRPYAVTGTRGMTALSIRQGDWKLTHMPFEGQSELVHLGRDPQETTDLAADQPQRLDHLQSLLDDYFLSESSRPGAQAKGKTLKEILAERE